jgi:hypothetical protein
LPATRISLNQVIECCRNAAKLSRDPHFSYHPGLRFHLSAYGMYGFAILSRELPSDDAICGEKITSSPPRLPNFASTSSVVHGPAFKEDRWRKGVTPLKECRWTDAHAWHDLEPGLAKLGLKTKAPSGPLRCRSGGGQQGEGCQSKGRRFWQ